MLPSLLLYLQWVTHSSSYIAVNQYMNWTDADAYCQSQYGTRLATITDDASAQALVAVRNADIPGDYNWIGLNDRANAGVYEWLDETPCPAAYGGTCRDDNGYPYWNPGWVQYATPQCVIMLYQTSIITDILGEAPCTSTAGRRFICNSPAYIAVNQYRNWSDAEAYCQSQYGTHLATIFNDDYARELVWNRNRDISGDYNWIGLNDEATAGVYEWTDGYDCPASYGGTCRDDNGYPYWNPGWVDYATPQCVIMLYQTSIITDILGEAPCTSPTGRRFICNANPTPTQAPTNAPSQSPTMTTAAPSKYPTNHPSVTPSRTPSTSPTNNPTTSPSIPTANPTSMTNDPTASPTVYHSESTNYYYHNTPMTWTDAEAYCQSTYATHLATIWDDNAANELLNFPSDTWFWIGLHDRNTEGTWEYADGSNTQCDSNCNSLKYWHPNEPSGGAENCANVWHVNNSITDMLNDNNCLNLYPFACNIKTSHPSIRPSRTPSTSPTNNPTTSPSIPTANPTSMTNDPTASPTVYHSESTNYYYHNTPMTWTDAEAYCQSTYATHLATIWDDDAADELFNFSSTNFWIGLHDRTTEGTWEYADGSNAQCDPNCDSLKYWKNSQPTGGAEDCAHVWRENANNTTDMLNDNMCTAMYPFVCNKRNQIACNGNEECKSNATLTTCPDHGVCDIICNGTQSCYTTTFTCPTDAECTIHCEDGNGQNYVCFQSTILAQQSTKLNVVCVGYRACHQMDIECPLNGDCDIQQQGDYALWQTSINASASTGDLNIESIVKNGSVSGSTCHASSNIYCPLSGNCDVNLYGYRALYYTTIHATDSDGILNITVSGREAFSEGNLYCPDAYQGTPNCIIRVIKDAYYTDYAMLHALDIHANRSFEQVSFESIGLADPRWSFTHLSIGGNPSIAISFPRMYIDTWYCWIVYVNGEYLCKQDANNVVTGSDFTNLCQTAYFCQYYNFQCDEGIPCNIDCNGDRACRYSTIQCPTNGACNVTAYGNRVMQHARMYCGVTGDCTAWANYNYATFDFYVDASNLNGFN
eukprot:1148307_1